jgi:hypothetical protein
MDTQRDAIRQNAVNVLGIRPIVQHEANKKSADPVTSIYHEKRMATGNVFSYATQGRVYC